MIAAGRRGERGLLALFFLVFLLLLGAGVSSLRSGLSIDTDMTAVLPENGFEPGLARAVDRLTDDVQSRITIVLSTAGSLNEPALSLAAVSLRNKLAAIPGVSVLPASEAMFTALLETLMPYRFTLLSQEQKQRLATETRESLIDEAVRALYRLGTPRLMDFAQDPFMLHQQTLMDLAPLAVGPSPSPEAGDRAFEVVSAVLGERALQFSGHAGLSAQIDQAIDAALAGALPALIPGQALSVDRSGVFFFALDAAERSKAEITLISTVSSLAIFVLLLWVFRRLTTSILPVLSVALGISGGFIVTHTLFAGVHVFAIVFGVGLIGVVIDYSLHYLYHSSRHSQDRSRLFAALGLSAVTSIIGYGALHFSSLAVLQSVAVFAVSGIAFSWLCVVGLGPYFAGPAPRRVFFVEWLSAGVRALAIRRSARIAPGLVFLVAGSLAVLAVLQIAGYRFTDNASVFFTPNPEILASEQRASAYASDFEPGRFVIITGKDEAELYRNHRALLALAAPAGADESALVSVLSWVPERAEQADNYQLQSALYGPQGAVGALYQSLGLAQTESMSDEYAAAANRYLSPETLIDALGPGLPTSWWRDEQGVVSLALIRKGEHVTALDALLGEHPEFSYVNMLARTGEALKQQRQSSMRLLCLAFALAGLMLATFYRSVSAIALIAVPGMSCLMTISVLILLGREVNLFHIMACFLILGFGMDYVIFARQMDHESDTTLQAIALSFITSQLSFGLLGLSNIGIVSSFGEALFIGNSTNLVGVLMYRFLRECRQHSRGD